MSPFLPILVLSLSPAFISASTPYAIQKAFEKCNKTNPVQRNPRAIVIDGIVTGAGFILDENERCHLLCFLQKVQFLNDEGEIRGLDVIRFARKNYPVIRGYDDLLYSQVFNIIRWTRREKDKCQKAMIAYFRLSDYLFMWATTAGMEKHTRSKNDELRKKIIEDAEEGRDIPAAIQDKISAFFADSDANTKMKSPNNLPLVDDKTSNNTGAIEGLEELFPGVYV